MSETKKTPPGWPKGVSGNPGGRPKGLDRQIREVHGRDALAIVAIQVDLALGRAVPGYDDVKAADRVKAGVSALDRIAGKVPTTIDGSLDLGASSEQLALLAALRMTPHERRAYLAQIDAEDERELAGVQDSTHSDLDATDPAE